ncbi:hypothetical protein PP175_25855 (plasmid) [Aneurinibacillus sp. Ricciae_BoGa-3]|uniref:hypothetical protein n=1 Tax=Aneurinibacillus sp. Ricciae_BoGa-3 TaxID=3022697 RepID=UPI0023422E1C|nr:hypothetical protein [Aneurinibacillus sp. Ricciae_BoGa-3]WCK57494.1 hypothetical protein PP175_25855 [Aneurinibacillus sp. Ricciae_BoGa-3]
MGEIADYYIERQFQRHMHPEREIVREKKERQYQMESLDDNGLMQKAEQAIKAKRYNERFIAICEKILKQNPPALSEKQRNCFYGLLGDSL